MTPRASRKVVSRELYVAHRGLKMHARRQLVPYSRIAALTCGGTESILRHSLKGLESSS